MSQSEPVSQLETSGGVLATALATGASLSMPGACQHCSGPFQIVLHSGPCPRIKAIEYHPNGAVKRIEFKEAPDA